MQEFKMRDKFGISAILFQIIFQFCSHFFNFIPKKYYLPDRRKALL